MNIITLKFEDEVLLDENKCYIHQLVGFYRGSANFLGSGIISVLPKKEFNINGLLMTLQSAGFKVEKI